HLEFLVRLRINVENIPSQGRLANRVDWNITERNRSGVCVNSLSQWWTKDINKGHVKVIMPLKTAILNARRAATILSLKVPSTLSVNSVLDNRSLALSCCKEQDYEQAHDPDDMTDLRTPVILLSEHLSSHRSALQERVLMLDQVTGATGVP